MRSETHTHTLKLNCGLGMKKSALNDMHRHCPIYHVPFKVYLSWCFEWCLFSSLTCFPVWKQLLDLPLSGIYSAFPFYGICSDYPFYGVCSDFALYDIRSHFPFYGIRSDFPLYDTCLYAWYTCLHFTYFY